MRNVEIAEVNSKITIDDISDFKGIIQKYFLEGGMNGLEKAMVDTKPFFLNRTSSWYSSNFDQEVMTFLLKMLERQYDDYIDIQINAMFLICNFIASDDDIALEFYENGIYDLTVALLAKSDLEMLENCLWCFANLSGSKPEIRDFMIESGFPKEILKIYQYKEYTVPVLKGIFWNISNLVANRNIDYSHFKEIAEIPLKFLNTETECLLCEVLNCYRNLSNFPAFNERIVTLNQITRMAKLVSKRNRQISYNASSTIGNIIQQSDNFSDIIFTHNLIRHWNVMLVHEFMAYRKLIVWIYSNIAMEGPEKIQGLIDENVLPEIMRVVSMDSSEVAIEGFYTQFTILKFGKESQVYEVIREGFFENLFNQIYEFCHDICLVKEMFSALFRISGLCESSENVKDSIRKTFHNLGGEVFLSKLRSELISEEGFQVYMFYEDKICFFKKAQEEIEMP